MSAKGHIDRSDDLRRIIRALEEALLDYVRRYGPTDKAREALSQLARSERGTINRTDDTGDPE
jgi:hypothetical protein